MASLRVFLFKKIHVEYHGQVIANMGSRKAQELFAYLLLHRTHFHHREVLADRLWGDRVSPQSRKSLRQTLWQLQATLNSHMDSEEPPLLLSDPEWIGINPAADFWVDIAVIEGAFASAQVSPGYDLNSEIARILESAVLLYQGDLLESWYQDWCLYQRERLQTMYLAILGKLMGYCGANQMFDAAIAYGQVILHHDRAHERTHRHLIRLLYLAGDRTGAIRQYQRCADALDAELGIKPSKSTMVLYEQIREDRLGDSDLIPSKTQLEVNVSNT
jgi:DNA-binding SARP family transcriptional activator